MDAVEDQYDCAVVISNDSDLFTPMEMVKKKYKKRLRLISPHKRKSAKLCQIADYITGIRKSDLQKSQFSEILTDKRGNFKSRISGDIENTKSIDSIDEQHSINTFINKIYI